MGEVERRRQFLFYSEFTQVEKYQEETELKEKQFILMLAFMSPHCVCVWSWEHRQLTWFIDLLQLNL